MADEIYTTRDARIPHETTIIHERSSSGAGGWLVAIVLVLALILGIWFFGQANDSRIARDNAITNAANNVGEAAKDVGAAAENAAQNVSRQ